MGHRGRTGGAGVHLGVQRRRLEKVSFGAESERWITLSGIGKKGHSR